MRGNNADDVLIYLWANYNKTTKYMYFIFRLKDDISKILLTSIAPKKKKSRQ